MSQNLSSAAVVIGALRVKSHITLTGTRHQEDNKSKQPTVSFSLSLSLSLSLSFPSWYCKAKKDTKYWITKKDQTQIPLHTHTNNMSNNNEPTTKEPLPQTGIGGQNTFHQYQTLALVSIVLKTQHFAQPARRPPDHSNVSPHINNLTKLTHYDETKNGPWLTDSQT